MRHIIFDHDGVIADSWDGLNSAFAELGLFGNTIEEIVKHQVEYSNNKPTHVRGGTMPEDVARRITKEMNDAFAIMIRDNSYKLFNEFVDEIKRLNDAKIALVSSNSSEHIKHCLKISKLPFTHALSFEDSTSKEEKIERIAKDWGVDIDDLFYVTDTLADVYELETFMPKKNIVGVAWGYCGYETLAKELPPDQILKEFKDIHKVF